MMVINKIEVFDETFFNELIRSAEKNKRHRKHYNIHDTYSDPCQKLLTH